MTGSSGSPLWKIEGTPLVDGIFNVRLTAKDQANSPGSRTVSTTLVLTIVPLGSSPPTIATQPVSRSITAGQNTTFTVVAGGSTPLRYHWRWGGNTLAGATNSTLALTNVNPGQAGGYDVVINNLYGSITSAVATLTVNLAVLPPAITAQLQNQTVTEGQDATFNVSATGTAPLYYLWRKGTAVFAVNNSSTFTIPGAALPDAGSYSVIVSNAAGTATGSAALLTVNPIPLPLFMAGTYNGLFFDSNNLQHASSGFFTASVRSGGDFTARLQNGTKKYSFKGRFDHAGRASNQVSRLGNTALMVALNIDLNGADRITGRVTDGLWSSELRAHRAVLHATTNLATALAGQYTLMIPGTLDGATAPLGDGFGSLKVDSAGGALFSGTMADGSRVTQRVGISGAGEWPLYVSLYSGRGSVLGWLRVRPGSGTDLEGVAQWIRPPGRVPKYYTNGFTLASSVAGSIYTPPVGGILETNAARVILRGGNLPEPSTNAVTLAAAGRVINAGPNALTFTLAPTTGLFKGTVKVPGVTRSIPFQGAVLRGLGLGGGYFLGTNEVGNVYFGP